MTTDVYMEFPQDGRGPDTAGRRTFVLYWWAHIPLDVRNPKSGREGWRCQYFFADPDSYRGRYKDEGRRVLEGRPPS